MIVIQVALRRIQQMAISDFFELLIHLINNYFPPLEQPALNIVTLVHHESENNNRIIQLTDAFCVLFTVYCTALELITISG